jgi:hypothetical protein
MTTATTRAGAPSVAETLRGAVDFHIHTSPDVFPRCVTAFTAAEQAKRAGMGAILVKSHSTDTAARAEMARDATAFPVFGGIALNYSVGGINPHAVRESVKQGGRIVSMPTLSAKFFIRHSKALPMLAANIPPGVRGVSVLRGNRLTAEADEILDIVAESGLILASGHISPEETGVLFTEARARGIRKLLVTHPLVEFVDMSVADMRALAKLGAYLEATVLPPAEGREESIRAVGAKHFLLSTDGGTTMFEPPVELLFGYAKTLFESGFTAAEVRHMAVDVPSYLLRLEGHTRRPTLT